MAGPKHDARLRRRRWAVAGAAALVALGGAAAAGAGGDLTITPPSGAPGTAYAVEVTCGARPAIKQHHTQDAHVPMTIAPYGPGDVDEVAPSLWRVDEVAGSTDEEYSAECGGAFAGAGRFDAESPHLWFGPRPQLGPDHLVGKTTVEGTDCPAGTEATVSIGTGDVVRTATAAIDEYGDWSAPLPEPVGDLDYEITAWCGSVRYDAIGATTTTPPTEIPPRPVPVFHTPPAGPTTPSPAAPAAAQHGTAGYTG